MNIKYAVLLFASCSLMTISCEKAFLDKQPRSALIVPKTLGELRALMDNDEMSSNYPQLGDISADGYSATTTSWQTYSSYVRNAYIWASVIFESETVSEWNNTYKKVFVANLVLETLAKIQQGSDNKSEWEHIKGTALFHRAFAFYHLSQLYCQTYIPSSASTDLGIPLRLTSDINAPVTRATVQQTYDRITQDLNEAALLLPDTVSKSFKARPNGPAAHALLARVYMIIGDYNKAKEQSDRCLSLYDHLLDYNTISESATRPFNEQTNTEILLQAFELSYGVFNSGTIIDTDLYNSYADNDIRKTAFFNTNTSTQNKFFKGQYTGLSFLFAGIALDEVYLIRSEARARLGDVEGALADLNTLLVKRWRKDTYSPFIETDPEIVLRTILTERKKELLLRGIRWSDLRRLNLEDRFKVELKRAVNNQEFVLSPGSKRYVLPIPPEEIHASGIEQNPR